MCSWEYSASSGQENGAVPCFDGNLFSPKSARLVAQMKALRQYWVAMGFLVCSMGLLLGKEMRQSGSNFIMKLIWMDCHVFDRNAIQFRWKCHLLNGVQSTRPKISSKTSIPRKTFSTLLENNLNYIKKYPCSMWPNCLLSPLYRTWTTSSVRFSCWTLFSRPLADAPQHPEKKNENGNFFSSPVLDLWTFSHPSHFAPSARPKRAKRIALSDDACGVLPTNSPTTFDYKSSNFDGNVGRLFLHRWACATNHMLSSSSAHKAEQCAGN